MKQKMKRALWTIVYCTIFGVNSTKAIEVDIDGLTYALYGVSATVLHVASGNQNTTIQIPSTVTYEGLTYTVNEIGDECFVNFNVRYSYTICENGKSTQYPTKWDIYPPNIVYDANGKWRVANSYVTNIILPETIEKIGCAAFCNTHITNVYLAEGVKQIDDYAFNAPKLESITLPNSLISIGMDAFACTKLKELVIPSSVESFGEWAFWGCSLLRKITYLGFMAPSNWVATTYTYVPNKKAYSEPSYSINDATITEMISFSGDSFSYTGKAPGLTWVNNMDGYTAKLTTPKLFLEMIMSLIQLRITKKGTCKIKGESQ